MGQPPHAIWVECRIAPQDFCRKYCPHVRKGSPRLALLGGRGRKKKKKSIREEKGVPMNNSWCRPKSGPKGHNNTRALAIVALVFNLSVIQRAHTDSFSSTG